MYLIISNCPTLVHSKWRKYSLFPIGFVILEYRSLGHNIFLDLISNYIIISNANPETCSKYNFDQSWVFQSWNSKAYISLRIPLQRCGAHTRIWLTKLSPLLHHLYRILTSRVQNVFKSLLQSCINLTRINFSSKSRKTFYLKTCGSETKKTQPPPPFLNHMAAN